MDGRLGEHRRGDGVAGGAGYRWVQPEHRPDQPAAEGPEVVVARQPVGCGGVDADRRTGHRLGLPRHPQPAVGERGLQVVLVARGVLVAVVRHAERGRLVLHLRPHDRHGAARRQAEEHVELLLRGQLVGTVGHRVQQPAVVVGGQPRVLPRRALLEAVAVLGGELRQPRTRLVARSDEPGLGVQQRPVGQRARCQHLVVGHQGEGEVGQPVLQRRAGVAAPRLELLQQRGVRDRQVAEVVPRCRTAVQQRSHRWFEPVRQALVDEPAAPTLPDEGDHRVAGHVAGIVGAQLPAGQDPAVLVGEVGQGHQHVGVGVGVDDRLQRALSVVGVPQRQLAVVVVHGVAVDALVGAAVPAVDVGMQVGEQLCVVQGGVEPHGVGRVGARHLDPPEGLLPGGVGSRPGRLEVEAGLLGTQVGDRPLLVGVGDADTDAEDGVGRVDVGGADHAEAAVAGDAPSDLEGFAVQQRPGHRLVHLQREVDGHRTGHVGVDHPGDQPVVAKDGLAAVEPAQRAPHVDDDVAVLALAGRGERVAVQAGAEGGGQLGGDAVAGEGRGVEARFGGFRRAVER